MKIAITGHTAGIGKSLAKQYLYLGHDIVGLSRREGHNILNIPKVCDVVETCDMFINNAQAGYAQTELLFEMSQRWTNTAKTIVIISTMLTQEPINTLPGLAMDHYRVQKIALEEAIRQIRFKEHTPRLILVRPGNIATSANKTVPPAADVENWAKTLIEILQLVRNRNLYVPDISLGPLS
jgi:nucleoside-diphosphate-sugar epimerase